MKESQKGLWHGSSSGLHRLYLRASASAWPMPLLPFRNNNSKKKPTPPLTTITTTALIFFFFFLCFLLVDASVFLQWCPSVTSVFSWKISTAPKFPILQCPQQENVTQASCPTRYPNHRHRPSTSSSTCPSYFRWIHEDLRHWKDTGITEDMIQRARETAHFRLVIVDGKAYVEKYKQSIQTRDMFTLWGILQLLRLYPGRVPDLELMFDCNDRPVVPAGVPAPPPLFRYCSNDFSSDIVFPDWSFWGWAETNIRPWSNVLKDIEEGNRRTKWKDRVPYAYWRGNPEVSPIRKDLMTCNVSEENDWNTRLYVQDWVKESKENFEQSNLGDQCTHRYKIYVEGWAWSVSEKYILACDSMTLYVRPNFYDFFSREMVPTQHYWPIRDNGKCPSLGFAVNWGNTHAEKAEAVGGSASRFVREDLKMEYVYDYMFHLLGEYAKLLKFKPAIPDSGSSALREVCSETVACPATGIWREFMEESMVKSPSETVPCSMPPPFDPPELKSFIDTKVNLTKQVEAWEDEFWQRKKTN